MAPRASCTFLHRSLMHARPASLDRLRVFPDRELRPSPGSAIFSLRDANALTHGVMGGAHRLRWACRVVWTEKRHGRATVRQSCADNREAQPPRWPPDGPRRHHTGNLPPGASATCNAKTACSAAGRSGTVRTGAMTQHRDTWTMVWQTQVTDALGHLLRRLVQTLRV